MTTFYSAIPVLTRHRKPIGYFLGEEAGYWLRPLSICLLIRFWKKRRERLRSENIAQWLIWLKYWLHHRSCAKCVCGLRWNDAWRQRTQTWWILQTLWNGYSKKVGRTCHMRANTVATKYRCKLDHLWYICPMSKGIKKTVEVCLLQTRQWRWTCKRVVIVITPRWSQNNRHRH